MAKNANAFGLSRHIPEQIKRAVRQRCGFGCVICGNAFYTYEHYDPEFKEASEHSADGITLLCAQHQGDTTGKRLTKKQVREWNEHPYCLLNGHPHHEMFLGGELPKVKLGALSVGCVKSVLEIDGKPVIGFSFLDNDWCRFALTATFVDRKGAELLCIVDNEIRLKPESWDVTAVGKEITIRSGPGEIILQISVNPPKGIWVKRANWVFDNFSFEVLRDGRVKVNDNFIQGGFYGNARCAFALYTELPFVDPLAE